MDTETSQVIERVSARIDSLEQRIDGRIDSLEQRIDGRIDSLEQRMDARFEAVDRRFESLEVTLRAEIGASLEESKRYAKVLNEDVRDDIRMLAESFAAMSVKLDSLQR